jgi:hypothetical protein
VDNVFDADYETGGIRNFNAFADPIDETPWGVVIDD